MSGSYDAIVIGAGHNGLTTAARLGRAGRRVLVLERRAVVGGLAASEQFHPGYRSAGMLADSGLVRERVIDTLELERHGLERRPVAPTVLALGNGQDGAAPPLPIPGDPERAAQAIAERSPHDGQQYRALFAQVQRLAPAIAELFDRHPLDLIDLESESVWDLGRRALRVRRLGTADLRELLRLPPMCVADVLGERFETERLRAALSLPALAGTFGGPWSPGTMLTLLRRECLAGPGVVGGGPMLVAALRGAAEAAGVQVRTEAAVARVRLRGTTVEGVVLDDGERIDAPLVAASCSPRVTLGPLLPPGALPHRLEHHIRNFRSRGIVAKVLLALDRPPAFGDEPVEYARTAEHVDDIERAFDAVKYGELPDTPVLDIHVPTVADPSLAPPGHAVLAVTVGFVPHGLRGGWTDQARAGLGDTVVRLLARHDPELPEAVVGRQVLTPVDLEARYGLPGGHLEHGEHGMDQLLIRPTPQCLHYATPIDGLWLCGSGSHPGGGLTCAPGQLAAEAILRAR